MLFFSKQFLRKAKQEKTNYCKGFPGEVGNDTQRNNGKKKTKGKGKRGKHGVSSTKGLKIEPNAWAGGKGSCAVCVDLQAVGALEFFGELYSLKVLAGGLGRL